MGGILQVDTIQNNNATTLITQTNSTTLTFGVSGQNIVIPSGVTFDTASATVNYPAGSISNAAIASDAAIATTKLGTGAVLQAVQAIFTGTQTLATGGVNANFSDITSLSVAITPSSSSNKILLIAHLTAMCGDDRMLLFKFTGGNTATFVGDTAGNKTRVAGFYGSGSLAGSANGAPVTLMYLDSPSTTSSTTYKVQGAPNFTSGNAHINFNPNETDVAYFPRGASSLIAIEVKG
jgi:hypothetical protein